MNRQEICEGVGFCDINGCDGCSASWTGFPADPRFEPIQVVEITDEELEQIQIDAFMEEVTKLWDQKFQEDLEADMFGFYEMDFEMEIKS